MPKQLTEEERSSLSWELSRLYGAGLSWPDSVDLLAAQKPSAPLAEALAELGQALTGGADLAEAMARTGRFPPEYLRQVELGQASGRLEQVLAALADYDRREGETHAALRGAVTYPLTMIGLIGAIFFFLAWRILPIFTRAFAQLGVAGVSAGGRLALMAVSGTCAAAALLLLAWFRRGGGLGLFARGEVGLAAARSRFASAMALMLQSGMALDESAERCAALLTGGPWPGPWKPAGPPWRREKNSPGPWRNQACWTPSRADFWPQASAPGTLRGLCRRSPAVAPTGRRSGWRAAWGGLNTDWFSFCARRWPRCC